MSRLNSSFGKAGGANTDIADRLPIVVSEINGLLFVSGLYWIGLDKVQGYMSEARAWAKKPEMGGMAIVAIRERALSASKFSVQAGFAPQRTQGASKGSYSMASAVAGSLGDHFVAALAMDDGRFVVVACSDGVIMYDEVLAEDQAERVVYKQIQKIQQGTKSERDTLTGSAPVLSLFVPESFGLAGSKSADLKDILAPKNLKKEYKLKQLAFGGLSPKELRAIVSVSAVALVVLFAAVQGWKAYSARATAQENERARQEAIAAAKRRAGVSAAKGPAAVPTLPHPWLRQPTVALLLKACTDETNKLEMAKAGFDLIKVTCSMGNVEVAYHRSPDSLGTLNDFKQAIQDTYGFLPQPDVADNGDTVHFKAGFALPEFKNDDQVPPLEADAMWDVISYFQRQAGAVEVHEVPAPPAAADSSGGKGTPPPVQDWKTYTWSVANSPTPADLILAGFNMPTARLTELSIARDPRSKTTAYSMKGEIYVH